MTRDVLLQSDNVFEQGGITMLADCDFDVLLMRLKILVFSVRIIFWLNC